MMNFIIDNSPADLRLLMVNERPCSIPALKMPKRVLVLPTAQHSPSAPCSTVDNAYDAPFDGRVAQVRPADG
ncbi:uncharacterized protein PgNI_08462 [Pyricularia grisea]|uniref:Uncharacterized protein n=1 Tax=Pyricularia grisea TaxID=148305 RepID=A0A6P8AX36_PYRGI|nr:uncharacterized protein PgNI_08462 [Pyricularia grisea]TLD06752.1 hypothetical protein PgNI_08462 [Pyricularia grisea]